MTESIVAYIGKNSTVTTWQGDVIGQAVVMSSWQVKSYIGGRMYAYRATIGGKMYHGRGFGESMSIVLRLCKRAQ